MLDRHVRGPFCETGPEVTTGIKQVGVLALFYTPRAAHRAPLLGKGVLFMRVS